MAYAEQAPSTEQPNLTSALHSIDSAVTMLEDRLDKLSQCFAVAAPRLVGLPKDPDPNVPQPVRPITEVAHRISNVLSNCHDRLTNIENVVG